MVYFPLIPLSYKVREVSLKSHTAGANTYTKNKLDMHVERLYYHKGSNILTVLN
jgi:hypothetical protein